MNIPISSFFEKSDLATPGLHSLIVMLAGAKKKIL